MMRHLRLLPAVLLFATLLAACSSQPSRLETGGLDQNDAIEHIMAKATRIIGSVTSVPTAEEALPELEQVNEQLGRLVEEAENLSPGARTELAEQAERYLPGMKSNAKRIGAWKGVGDILGPTMVELVDKLAALR